MSNLTLKGFEETPELLALRNKESKYPIFGLRFLLDEDKIKELKYPVAIVYKAIDVIAQKYNLVKVGFCAYAGQRDENDLAQVTFFNIALLENVLFCKCVKELIAIEGANSDIITDGIAVCKKIKLGNFKNE